MLGHEFQDPELVHAQWRVHSQAQEAFLMCPVRYKSATSHKIKRVKKSEGKHQENSTTDKDVKPQMKSETTKKSKNHKKVQKS